MKVYSPSDMADILQIKPATLRKYSALLEQYGYEIQRNKQRHRYYQDKDIIAIRDVIRGANGGATLEKSVQNVVKLQTGSELTNDTNNGDESNDSDIQELKEMIGIQNELIKGLTERLDQQEEYIKESIHDRDMKLLQSIDEIVESKRQIEEPKQEKGFFARLFNK